MSDYEVFRCPGCKELVNNTMAACPHCSLSLEGQTIKDSIEVQDRVNNAYNSASNVRILAGAMWMAFFFSFIPFIGIIGRIGFWLAFVGVPIALIVWLIRYGRIPKTEPEIKDSRRFLLAGLGLWAIYPIAYIALITIVYLGLLAASR